MHDWHCKKISFDYIELITYCASSPYHPLFYRKTCYHHKICVPHFPPIKIPYLYYQAWLSPSATTFPEQKNML